MNSDDPSGRPGLMRDLAASPEDAEVPAPPPFHADRLT